MVKFLKLPKTINILGREWKMIIEKEVSNTAHGTTNYELREIRLSEGWKPVIEVLSHELGHSFLFETNIMKNNEGNAQVLGLFISDILNQIR
jgi:hypothetical protein